MPITVDGVEYPNVGAWNRAMDAKAEASYNSDASNPKLPPEPKAPAKAPAPPPIPNPPPLPEHEQDAHDTAPGKTASPHPGADMVQWGLDQGRSPAEMLDWKARRKEFMLKAGAPPAEVDKYWGDNLNPNTDQLDNIIRANVGAQTPAVHEKMATNALEALQAGLQTSVSGLVWRGRNPDTILPQDAGMLHKVASGIGTFAGDLPAIGLGAIAGGVVGAGVGSTVPIAGSAAGAVVGAGAGSAGLPEALRQSLMDQYAHPEGFKTWADFWNRASSAMWDTSKAAATGAVAYPVGRYVGGALASRGVPAIAASTANVASYAVTSTAVGGALGGQVPDAAAFTEAAAVALTLHGAGTVIGAARRFVPSPATEQVAENLRDIYSRTGLHPHDAVREAIRNPDLEAEILAPRTADGEVTTPVAKALAPPEPPPFTPENKIEPPPLARPRLTDKRPEPEPEPGAATRLTIDPRVQGIGHGQEPVLKEILEDASKRLPPGWHAEIISAERPGAVVAGTNTPSQHASAAAMDIVLIGPDGKRHTNIGRGPGTPEFDTYRQFAQEARNAVERLHPELHGQFEWGGNFTSPGPNQYDLMHFSLGSEHGLGNEARTPTTGGHLYAPTPGDVTPAHLNIFRTLENSGDHDVSPAGAIGRGQIMPDTARFYGFDPSRLHDPAYNETVTKAIISDLSVKFDGNLTDMLVAYNAGPGRARQWIANGRKISDLPVETQKYLENADRHGFTNNSYLAWGQTRRQLTVQGESGAWVPPDGEPLKPSEHELMRQAREGDRGGGEPPPRLPPGGGVEEPPGGPRKVETNRIHLNDDMALDQMSDIVAPDKAAGTPDWMNPRKIIEGFRAQLTPARRIDNAIGLGPRELGVEDMLRQTFASKERAGVFIRWGVLDPITLGIKHAASWMSAFKAVKEDGGTNKGFMEYRLAARTVEKAEQGAKAKLRAEASVLEREATTARGAVAGHAAAAKSAAEAHVAATEARAAAQQTRREARQYQDTARAELRVAERAETEAANELVRRRIATGAANDRADAAAHSARNKKGEAFTKAANRLAAREAEIKAARTAEADARRDYVGAKTEAGRKYGIYRNAREAYHTARDAHEKAAEAERAARETRTAADQEHRGAERAADTAERQAREKRAEAEVAKGIDTGIDLEKARDVMSRPSIRAKYERGTAILRMAKDGAIDYARDSGLFTPTQAEAIKSLNREHIIFRRVFDPDYNPPHPGRGFGVRAAVRKMTGSQRQIVDPMTAEIDNLHTIIAMADRNRAVGAVIGVIEGKQGPGFAGQKLLWHDRTEGSPSRPHDIFDENGNPIAPEEAPGLEPFLAERGTGSGGLRPDEFAYFRNGKREIWRAVDPDLAALMRMPVTGKINPVAEALSKFAGLARLGIVQAIDFPFRATLHGQLAASAFSRGGNIVPFQDAFHGLMDVWNQGDNYKRWVANGGAGTALTDMDVNYIKKDVNEIFDATGTTTAVWNSFLHPIDALRSMYHMIDAASRVGAMQRLENRGYSTLKAATLSRTAYLDNAEGRTASWLNTWARMVPFMEIGFKDVEQVASALYRKPVATMVIAGTVLTMPTVMNYALNYLADQGLDPADRYDQVPRWERDLYWVTPPINGVRMKIKRPYVGGFLFSTLPERFLDFARQDANAFKEWAETFVAQVVPPFIPTALAPIEEQRANKSFLTNRPLVKASLEKVSDYMQYGPNTSLWAQKLAQAVGPAGSNWSDVSPIVLENYAKQWLGPLPMTIARVLETPFRPEGKPWETADVPFLGAFFARHQPGQQTVQDFYDAKTEFEKAHGDVAVALKEGDFSKVSSHQLLQAGVSLHTFSAAMQQQRNALDIIYRSKMTNDEKRKYTDAVGRGMLANAKAGLSIIDTVKAIH